MIGLSSIIKTKLLIFEEHPVTRWGLRHFLDTRDDIFIVGEAGSVAEAMDLIHRYNPEIVITDIALIECDGIDFVKQILMLGPRKILAFSAADSWERVEKFLKAGGMGFVTKRCTPEELIMAIDAINHNRQWVSPSLRKVNARSGSGVKDHVLSPREREVVVLVARGLTSRQIADQLCVSLKTIETHRYRIFRELQIKSRAQLVNYAIQNGLMGNVQ